MTEFQRALGMFQRTGDIRYWELMDELLTHADRLIPEKAVPPAVLPQLAPFREEWRRS